MKLQSIAVRALEIPFKSAFKHASAERAATQAVWVEARTEHGITGYGEGCPREYVTGESIAGARAFVDRYREEWMAAISDVASLSQWRADHRSEIDDHPAAWCAAELALLDAMGKTGGQPLEALLGLPPLTGAFRYTAVLGDAAPREFGAALERYLKSGFRDFKIKLSTDGARDREKVRLLQQAGLSSTQVRADANNLWMDAESALRTCDMLAFRFHAIEEPLRAGDLEGMRRIAQAFDSRIVLDESVTRTEQLAALATDAGRWIVNLRVSKMGGVLRSLVLVHAARNYGIPLIIGAHVGETSVLTRAALAVAHAARDVLIAQEGAFGTHLLAQDVIEPPLMFGAGGVLDADAWRFGDRAGLGLDIAFRQPAAAS